MDSAAGGGTADAERRRLQSLALKLSQLGRFAEASVLHGAALAHGAAERSRAQLEEARRVDDRLEEAAAHRDAMRRARRAAAAAAPLALFCAQHPHVAAFPFLGDGTGGVRDDVARRTAAALAVPGCDTARVLRSAAEETEAAWALQPRTAAEALLAGGLAELCRAVLHTACAAPATAPAAAAALPADAPPVGAASAGAAWRDVLAANVAALLRRPEGPRALAGLRQLYAVCRSTQRLRVCVEVRAATSVALAELRAVLDIVDDLAARSAAPRRPALSRGPSTASVSSREAELAAGARCAISGLPLEDGGAAAAAAVVTCGGAVVHPAAAALWARAVRRPLHALQAL